MLAIGLTVPTSVQAASDYSIPECPTEWVKQTYSANDDNAWEKDVAAFNARLASGAIPGPTSITESMSVTEKCGDQGLRITYSNGDKWTIYKIDDGLRIWGENLKGTYSTTNIAGVRQINGSQRGGLYYVNGTFAYTNYYYLSIITGATIKTAGTGASGPMSLNATASTAVYQVTDSNDQSKVMPVLDANDGMFQNTYGITTPVIAENGLADWTASHTPTRPGYTFKQWSTDQAGQHPIDAKANVNHAEYLYAQWEKTAGDPQKVDLDCSTGGRCELTVNYANSTALTREFQPGSAELSWAGAPITGVRLDANGYAADGACSDVRCWYVSLEKAPQNSTSYQAQMPTTGAPEGLSQIGMIAIALGLMGLSVLAVKRNRV
ncbi:InlB B-repeat-containing protein [Bifidobacterium callitrichidarum]|uniref:Uncharacterized protein n=1 Tax=Bifidobacterium callitrichidarum TaxID=2052941 RepID=A0A2U2NCA7_9BIFI|nr:InlB B-repeat-containing protein [Bifidobacterium callitrichidarum]PWG66786.1 hypothetical protein DF196_02465 [Bifidobacterium callitrichidarum]